METHVLHWVLVVLALLSALPREAGSASGTNAGPPQLAIQPASAPAALPLVTPSAAQPADFKRFTERFVCGLIKGGDG